MGIFRDCGSSKCFRGFDAASTSTPQHASPEGPPPGAEDRSHRSRPSRAIVCQTCTTLIPKIPPAADYSSALHLYKMPRVDPVPSSRRTEHRPPEYTQEIL